MLEGTDTKAVTARIVILDSDPVTRQSITSLLAPAGYDLEPVGSAQAAAQLLQGSSVDLVIVDVSGPATDGLDVLRRFRRLGRDVSVIFVSSYGTVESAVEAVKQGAADYLTKPLTADKLCRAVEKALARSRAGAVRYGESQPASADLSHIIGQDKRMVAVFDMIEAVADTQTTVLITGQSGTGKSLIARAIHARSPRRGKPFVEVACGAIPDTLLESELFGHVRGAFTDAMHDKEGKFAAADGGTIFLDEIATASPQLQVKLLRVLQDRQFEPVGSNETMQVDVRVILATNRDLWQEVEAGRFRQDLYYRVNVINIELPSLRQRPGDIPLLAEHFLRKYAPSANRQILGFSPPALAAMRRYHWPGNVRELENCVERAVVLCRDAYIGLDDLPPALLSRSAHAPTPVASTQPKSLKQALAEPEKQIILAALEANGGNRQATARQLGINRTTLYKKMKRYGLTGR